jgi:hypothetical protein
VRALSGIRRCPRELAVDDPPNFLKLTTSYGIMFPSHLHKAKNRRPAVQVRQQTSGHTQNPTAEKPRPAKNPPWVRAQRVRSSRCFREHGPGMLHGCVANRLRKLKRLTPRPIANWQPCRHGVGHRSVSLVVLLTALSSSLLVRACGRDDDDGRVSLPHQLGIDGSGLMAPTPPCGGRLRKPSIVH